jgi:protein SCO1/2
MRKWVNEMRLEEKEGWKNGRMENGRGDFTYYALLITLLVCWLAGPVWAQGLSAGNQPAVLREIGIDQRPDRQVPLDLVFRDETGKSVRLGDYFGEKPVLLSLVYYECPMLCTLVLNGLLRSLRALAFDVGKQFNVVTVSVDPGETPSLAAAKKAEYIQKYSREGAEKGWHFLTGEEDSIQALADAVGFRYVYQPDRDEYAHASGIMILTPQGKLARYFYGIEYSTRDVRLALVEASANKIGSPVDQLLLYCYHYDPVTGKYGLLIMNTIRLAGLATVLALGVFMFVMFRRDRLQNSTIERTQPLG